MKEEKNTEKRKNENALGVRLQPVVRRLKIILIWPIVFIIDCGLSLCHPYKNFKWLRKESNNVFKYQWNKVA